MTRRRTTRRGFTLLEMVIVMSALGVAFLLGGVLLVAAMKAERMGTLAGDRVDTRAELARQFRADVAGAAALPDAVGDHRAGPACLILREPDDGTVIYRWANATLERIERKGETESRRTLPVGPPGTAVEFVRPASGSGVVTLRITEPVGVGPAKRSELSAAPGGDLR